MSKVGVPWSEYARDEELREVWHAILSSPKLLKRLPSNTWHGWKLQEILWSGKIDPKNGDWEELLVKLWSK